MRQQLISWLVEDIAPEIRRSRDAEGEILKFARDHNLATAQVQAMGQLYNTAKTLSFFDKSASRRGDPFPILDVDKMLNKFEEVEKRASIPHKFEYDDQDGGCGLELPACFSGLTHNVLQIEQPAPAQIFDNPVKRASADRQLAAITIEFAQQAKFEYQEEMRKSASALVTGLRRNPTYTFEELEADAWGIYGDDVKPIMEKLAKYCQDDGWPVKRATAPSENKLVMDPNGLIPLVENILDNTYGIKAAQEILQPSSEAAGSGPMLTAAKIVEKNKLGDIELKTAKSGSASSTIERIDPAKIEDEKNQGGDAAPGTPSEGASGAGESSPKGEGSAAAGGAGHSGKPPGDVNGSRPSGGGRGGRPGEAAGAGGVFDNVSAFLDKIMGPAAKNLPGALMKSVVPSRNAEQERVDSAMRDAKHIATLQNLMTTDEILAEADPDQVVNIYNTIRNMAPEIAGDANVMRVLLRSAVQHEGISPYDLKGILDTELAKQKVDEGQRRMSDSRYNLKVPSGPKAQREE